MVNYHHIAKNILKKEYPVTNSLLGGESKKELKKNHPKTTPFFEVYNNEKGCMLVTILMICDNLFCFKQSG